MSKLAYNTFSAPDRDASDLLDDVAAAGFAGVGLFSRHVQELAASDATGVAARGLAALGSFVVFLDPADDVGGTAVAGAVEDCRRCGVPALVVIPTPRWSQTPGWQRRFGSALAELSAAVRILLEPLSPKMAAVTCLHEVGDALAALSAVPGGRGGWILDVAQLHDLSPGSLEPAAVDRLEIVQLADLADSADHPDRRVAPGDGALPLSRVVSDLGAAGFAGWWEVELGPDAAATRASADALGALRARSEALLEES